MQLSTWNPDDFTQRQYSNSVSNTIKFEILLDISFFEEFLKKLIFSMLII